MLLRVRRWAASDHLGKFFGSHLQEFLTRWDEGRKDLRNFLNILGLYGNVEFAGSFRVADLVPGHIHFLNSTHLLTGKKIQDGINAPNSAR